MMSKILATLMVLSFIAAMFKLEDSEWVDYCMRGVCVFGGLLVISLMFAGEQ